MTTNNNPENELSVKGEWHGEPYRIDNIGLILPNVLRGPVIVYDEQIGIKPTIERMDINAQWLRLDNQRPEDEENVLVSLESNMHIGQHGTTKGRLAHIIHNFLVPPATDDGEPSESPLVFERTSSTESYLVTDLRNSAKFLIRLANLQTDPVITVTNRPVLNADGTYPVVATPLPNPIHNIHDLQGQLVTVMETSMHIIHTLNAHRVDEDDLAPPIELPDGEQDGEQPNLTEGARDDLTIWQKSFGEETIDPAEERVTLSSVAGLHLVKAVLEDIILMYKKPESMKLWELTLPHGILFHGPEGTGKTLLAEALSNEIGADFWKVGSEIYSKWVGESPNNLKKLFEDARNHKGLVVLFFDEIDGLIRIQENPGSGGADAENNLVASVFKQEMNNLSRTSPNVLVVAATNRQDRMDKAITRYGRFDYKLYVPLPDEAARGQIFALHIAKSIMKDQARGFNMFADIDILNAAKSTDGFSGAEIVVMLDRAKTNKWAQEARYGIRSTISNDDMLKAIKTFRENG